MRILLALDGSGDAVAAGAFIQCLRLEEGDEIDLLHVLEETWGIRKSFKDFERVRRVRDEFAERILGEGEEYFTQGDITLRSVRVEGLPEKEILGYASRMNVDLIALGASGFPEADAVRLGSVARKVVTEAEVPVLVVREGGKKVEPGRPWRVVFGTDGSTCARKAAAALNTLPVPEGSTLVVMSAVDSPLRVMPERFSLELDATVKDAIAEARRHEIAAAEDLVTRDANALGTTFSAIETRVPLGEPTTEILAEAEKDDADLIVVGCRGLRGMKGMLGSVSRRILSKAPCSVLVSKMPGN